MVSINGSSESSHKLDSDSVSGSESSSLKSIDKIVSLADVDGIDKAFTESIPLKLLCCVAELLFATGFNDTDVTLLVTGCDGNDVVLLVTEYNGTDVALLVTRCDGTDVAVLVTEYNGTDVALLVTEYNGTDVTLLVTGK